MIDNVCGIQRVIGQKKLPVHAWKLNNDKKIKDNEILIQATKMHLENGNFNQIYGEASGKEEKIKEAIHNIVNQRGKMHNPYTGTAGMIAGTVEEIGSNCKNEGDLKVGDEIIIPVSASMLPLSIKEIKKIDYIYGHIDIEGYTVIYDGCPTVKKPKDIPWDLLLVAFEESASIEKVNKLSFDKDRVLIIGSNPVVTILYSLAVRQTMSPNGQLVGVIYEDKLTSALKGTSKKNNDAFSKVFDEVYFMESNDELNCTNAVTENGNRLFDVIINCADQMGAEDISVMAAKKGGSVFFSNLSNNYTMALFIQEAINRDMVLQCAAGYSSGYYEYTLELLYSCKDVIEDIEKNISLINEYNDENIITETEQTENQQIIQEILTFKSPKIKKLTASIEKVAKFDIPIIINGESGSGKEVMADLIHKMSNRKHAPYVKVNCAAIPKELMESEFFGYEKGAFTGAKETGKKGYFEMAKGGTILLDEIGELPMDMQAKLLRIMQNGGECYKVGGNTPINVDARIIAATNKNLMELVKQGNFREDLYYRLAVVKLNIPPLRERPEDIVPLAQLFVERYNKKYDQNKVISEEGLEKLKEYNWPGNVRELENSMYRGWVSATKNTISGLDILGDYEFDKTCDSTMNIDCEESFNVRIANFEQNIIRTALIEHGSTYKAAAALEMTQSQFMRKKKKYNI